MVDSPPDLVVEVEIIRSSLNKLAIDAAFGIPEVRRFDDEFLEFLHRQNDGRYLARDMNRSFPVLGTADVAEFLDQAESMDKTA